MGRRAQLGELVVIVSIRPLALQTLCRAVRFLLSGNRHWQLPPGKAVVNQIAAAALRRLVVRNSRRQDFRHAQRRDKTADSTSASRQRSRSFRAGERRSGKSAGPTPTKHAPTYLATKSLTAPDTARGAHHEERIVEWSNRLDERRRLAVQGTATSLGKSRCLGQQMPQACLLARTFTLAPCARLACKSAIMRVAAEADKRSVADVRNVRQRSTPRSPMGRGPSRLS